MFKINYSEKDLELKKFSTSSKHSESNLYLCSNDIVCKVPKNENYTDNIIRSYYIGKILNSLSFLVPNFVYTYELIKNKRGQIFLTQEYVKGKTFEEEINNLSFSQFLNIFIQILVVLEIARQYYNFVHYDLHLSNIILKKIKKSFEYTVKINSKKYTIKVLKYIPIIIDFGYSYIKYNDEIICFEGGEQYGIYCKSYPGLDMYKLLFHSYIKSNKTLQKEIFKLFFFYENKDPYKVLETSLKIITKIPSTYFTKLIKSDCAYFTPLEFIFWLNLNSKLLSFPKYFQENKE